MHTTFTSEIARQIVSDRVRAADTARLARKARPRRWFASGTSVTVEPVVRRSEPRETRLTTDVVGAC